MRTEFKPRLFYEGMGNVEYFGLAKTSSALTGANDGLNVDTAVPGIARLGQPVGTVGNPAALLTDREIPTGTKVLYLGSAAGGSFVAINGLQGIDSTNVNGAVIQSESFAQNFHILYTDANHLEYLFASLSFVIDNLKGQLTSNFPFVPSGLGSSIRPATSLVADAFAKTDYTVLFDTTAGNANFSITPATIPNQEGNVKKLTADLNTVTLTVTAGLIYGGGTSATTFVYSGAGENIHFQSDGVNLYIL